MATSAAVVEAPLTQAVGGGFLLEPVRSRRVYTPEDFTEEQLEFRRLALEFAQNEVEPRVEAIELKKPGVMVALMKQAAELGFLMAEIPEAYGGLGLDKATSMLVAEAMARVGSFAVTYGAHTGIGTLPIVYYGTDVQKHRYLPKLGSGEMIAAYALSEAGSGSDALSATTQARLAPDGQHYVLTGTKQWITNAAWADLFTVFAQVDGDKFSAFLVERRTPGVSVGAEEHKLGIRGSSTCQVNLDDVRVPVENLLGEVGRGHKIAFNILNIGRYKLGIGSVGAAKHALSLGVRYARERRQFKKPIASFGLIRQKIATAAQLIYAGESMAYRLAGLIDAKTRLLDSRAPDYVQRARDIVEEFTIESSILKVFGSEANFLVADEMLQIHGGNGYTEDYPMERILRDARINRIFEGTNEINRLIIPATLLKRALKGELALLPFVQQINEELAAGADALPKKGEGLLAFELWAAENVKRAFVYSASYAVQKYMDDLKEKQRVLGPLADCLIDIYGMDSVLNRALQATETLPADKAELQRALASLFCFEARAAIFQRLRRIAMIMCEGKELDAMYDSLGKLDQRYRVDYMGLQDLVAKRMLDDAGYAVSI